MNSVKDTKARSLVKGISWRFFGTVDTFLIAFLFTGEFSVAAPIAVSEVFTKILLYFLHERGWNLIPWGRTDQQISHTRSLAKGISWRIVGTLDTIILSWIFSGNPFSALKIGVTEVLTKVLLYYLHERAWTAIKWGRVRLSGSEN